MTPLADSLETLLQALHFYVRDRRPFRLNDRSYCNEPPQIARIRNDVDKAASRYHRSSERLPPTNMLSIVNSGQGKCKEQRCRASATSGKVGDGEATANCERPQVIVAPHGVLIGLQV